MKLIATALAVLATLVVAPSASADEALPAQLHESFAAVPDGPAPATLVGTQTPVTNYSGGHAAPAPFVRSGSLSTADPTEAEGGSYRIAHLGADVTTVGATFAFTPYTGGGGLLCLSIQADSIATGAPVPVSPLHFLIDPLGWSVDVNAEAGTGVDPVLVGHFDKPLVADGKTLHRVEVELDRSTQSIRVTFPDGTQTIVSHPGFGLPGAYVYVEPFKSAGGVQANKTDALVSDWWASTTPVAVGTPRAEVTPAPVVVDPPVVAAPAVAPRWARAHRSANRIAVKWSATGSTATVTCGRSTRTTNATSAVLRGRARHCTVRTAGGAVRVPVSR